MLGRHHTADKFGFAVKVTAILSALGFIYLQEYLYALFSLPVFALDVCIPKPNRTDSFVNLFKLFLLCQGVGLWYLNHIQFFNSSAYEMQEVYTAQKEYGWQNASTMLRGIGQRTIHSLVNNVISAEKYMVGSVLHQYTGEVFPVTLSASNPMNKLSRELLNNTFGELYAVDFPDLQYYTKEHVQQSYPKLFSELPKQFDPHFKNPCWERAESDQVKNMFKKLECLPYAYILGQPKSGTSDLFERMKEHNDIVMPSRKEVRWFTRGEFAHHKLPYEGHGVKHPNSPTSDTAIIEGITRSERLLGSMSSVYTFTKAFRDISMVLAEEYESESTVNNVITIDGGPHTLWWPLQAPDGSFLYDIPPTQLLREMQPDAKFIITLNDPVRRMYSDYYFLHDNLKPLRVNMIHNKSADEFHERAARQVNEFNSCIRVYMDLLKPQLQTLIADKGANKGSNSGGANNSTSQFHMPHLTPLPGDEMFPIWFRSAQMCAHDRYTFGVGGHGRLNIGLYVLFIEKWLEHFSPDQFLVVRLEDYEKNPRLYMSNVFEFLHTQPPEDWTEILKNVHFNAHKIPREALHEKTEQLLRAFYRPYNDLLAKLLEKKDYKWEIKPDKNGVLNTLRESILRENGKLSTQGNNDVDVPKTHHHATHDHYKPKPINLVLSDNVDQDNSNKPEPSDDKEPLSDPTSSVQEPNSLKTADALEREKAMHKTWAKARAGDKRKPSKMRSVNKNKYLRGHSSSSNAVDSGTKMEPFHTYNSTISPDLLLHPRRFDTTLLTQPAEPLTADSFAEREIDLSSVEAAGDALCSAAFTLDLPLIVYLLHDLGIDGSLVTLREAKRNALHCLTLLFTLADAHSASHVFSLLKGKESWLNAHFNPPMEIEQHSVLSRDIITRLEPEMIIIAEWLVSAGVRVDGTDIANWTPLHVACIGGETQIARFLLQQGADANAKNRDHRTPLHFAAALGHAELASILIQFGANKYVLDKFNTMPIDIIANPGPISAEHALLYLNTTQRAARQIQRLFQPELSPETTSFYSNETQQFSASGWIGGTGNWDTHRLKGFEQSHECTGIDQFYANEITEEEVMHNYLARNAPVMIRGLLEDWKLVENYKKENLLKNYGDLNVQVSDIPYADKFGGEHYVEKTLSEYIQEIESHHMTGGAHPWYVFKGNTIPLVSDAENSIVSIEDCPTPTVLQKAFEQTAGENMRNKKGVEGRKIFVNAQWALGGEGTGAPVHYHNSAWNALIYGAKLWVIYPPHNMIMSNKQMLDYYETDMNAFVARGVKPVTCVQTAGDVLIIPESWGHGVLNIQESVAMATEAKNPLFRMTPGTKLFRKHAAAPPKFRPPKG